MIGNIRFVQTFEFFLVFFPWEFATIDDTTTQTVSMTVHRFGQGIHHDIGTEFERTAQIGSRDRVVDDEGNTVSVRNFGQLFDISDIAERIADGFTEDSLRLAVDPCGEIVFQQRIGKTDFNAILRERMGKQVICATVKRTRRDDIIADFRNGLNGIRHSRHTGCQSQPSDTPFQSRNPFFQHVVRRIHDTGINIARHFQIEQVCAVLRAVESISHCLVNRHRNRFGNRIRGITGVNRKSFEFHGQ